jgi:hypothetical protein
MVCSSTPLKTIAHNMRNKSFGESLQWRVATKWLKKYIATLDNKWARTSSLNGYTTMAFKLEKKNGKNVQQELLTMPPDQKNVRQGLSTMPLNLCAPLHPSLNVGWANAYIELMILFLRGSQHLCRWVPCIDLDWILHLTSVFSSLLTILFATRRQAYVLNMWFVRWTQHG